MACRLNKIKVKMNFIKEKFCGIKQSTYLCKRK